MNSRGVVCGVVLSCCVFMMGSAAVAASKSNVLLIAIDDLRPALGCYGLEQAITPNMDSFSKHARLFRNHYVQVPTCGASRYSMLTGVMPRVVQDVKNDASHALAHVSGKNARSMPELFRRNGYRTVFMGKVSHGADDLPDAWDENLTPPGIWDGKMGTVYAQGRYRDDGNGYNPYCEFKEVADNELPDGMYADAAVERLEQFGKTDEPFFMAVGFQKPHLPFVAPKKYRELYDGVAFPSAYAMKRGDTRKAGKSGEFYLKYHFPFEKPAWGETLSEADAQEVRRAYLACVSYVDVQVGRVLRALERSGRAENTIVVLWGDHGWHLGENNAWAKHTPLEPSMRCPLMIRVPGMNCPGVAAESLAATLDIYPTLLDLCELKIQETAQPIEGVSLRPLLENPTATVRNEVVSFWYSTSMTDGRYRLIVSPAKEQEGYSYELYDHQIDPGELVNLASQNPEKVSLLMAQLKRAYPQILIK